MSLLWCMYIVKKGSNISNVQSEPVIPNSADNESQRHASNDLQITTQKTSEFGTLLNKKKVRR